MTPPQVMALTSLLQQYWGPQCAVVLPAYTPERLAPLWAGLVWEALQHYGMGMPVPPTLRQLLRHCREILDKQMTHVIEAYALNTEESQL